MTGSTQAGAAQLAQLRDPLDRRLPRVAGPSALVIFGVTGDLAQKKLLPAVYDLAARGLLHPAFTLIGYGRRDWSDEHFAEVVQRAVQAHARMPFVEETWQQLARGIRFVTGTFADDAGFDRLAATLADVDATRGVGGNHAFYLSVPPNSFATVCQQLARVGLDQEESGWRRVIIEKPFGHDLASARQLDATVSQVFREESVFRIDHYLGKETVQNLLALRFANTLFEPVWNANYVDHVQITMAEDIGIGSRAGYYDGIGAARDIIQNHLLQLLALTAMEEPASLDPDNLRREKIKVLEAVQVPDDLSQAGARGRYGAGWQGGTQVRAYVEEDGISPDSVTETYAAVRLFIANRRWAGVPFYLRAGKRLGRRVTEIAVVFKKPLHSPFHDAEIDGLGHNALVVRVQPDEGVTLRFGAKVPGTATHVRDVTMDFNYGHAFTEISPEAYERLILDVLLGDPPLFPRQQEVELSWQILDPILAHWAAQGPPETYAPGSWGPPSADELLAADGRAWRLP